MTNDTHIRELRMQLSVLRNREEDLVEMNNKTSAQRGELNALRNKIYTIKYKIDNLKNHLPILGKSINNSITLHNHGTTSTKRKTGI